MSNMPEAWSDITPPSADAMDEAQQRLRAQARPAGSLGRLEEMGARLAAMAGTLDVRLKRKVIVTCAGDHGVVAEGVTLFPSEVTQQMVYNFVDGGASVNVLGRHAGAEQRVADLGVDHAFEPDLPIFHKKVRRGTDNLAAGPAMSRDEAVQSVQAGIDIVAELKREGGLDILAMGDMGIGNTTPSTAVIAAVSGLPVSELTGRGTGIDDQMLHHKVEVIERALDVNQPAADDALDVLAKVGGFEIGGLAGLALGAALHGVPVVCDGLISTAGALIAARLQPEVKAYLFAGHRSVEVGHQYMLQQLEQEPILDLNLRLGEGTGAALALELLDAATRVLAEIRTFEEVAIADKNRA